MFYELENSLINLDKIYTVRKLINEELDKFTLEIRLDINDSENVVYVQCESQEKLLIEYRKIKLILKSIYG